MLKFAVGYQQCADTEDSFLELARDFRDSIDEVYFPWADMPSGRAALTSQRGYVDWSGQERLESDLIEFAQMGMKLDLLFNANCYGGRAVSVHLENRVISIIEYIFHKIGRLDAVTTTSPAIARTVKINFPSVEVRASVNMRIGSVQGMRYIAEWFDGYYVQRDYNRNLSHIAALKKWADENNKRLYLLANSGCLSFCSGQTFHDNLVAHEDEVDETLNIRDWTPHVCWNLLKDRTEWPAILQSTWIRPEDLSRYEMFFPVVKLATRMHARPRMVVQSYAERRHRGNLTDLFEPSFSPALVPFAIDNERFPADWFIRTSTCKRDCHQCSYCKDTLEEVLIQPI